MPVYQVPTTRNDDGVLMPAHDDEHETQPEHYRRHYRDAGETCYISASVSIGTYEELAEDEDSAVIKVSDSDGTDDYPAPKSYENGD